MRLKIVAYANIETKHILKWKTTLYRCFNSKECVHITPHILAYESKSGWCERRKKKHKPNLKLPICVECRMIVDKFPHVLLVESNICHIYYCVRASAHVNFRLRTIFQLRIFIASHSTRCKGNSSQFT